MALSMRYANIGMVSFIDLLGYSARVEAVETESDLKAIEKDVRRVQKWFDHRPKDDGIREVQKLQAKKVLAFSDCLVITVPSSSELAASEGDFDIQLGEMVTLAYAQGMCAANGIFIRGGIDYGLWYKRRDTIISPAMIGAYKLEQTAVVPMLAISDDLILHFQDHPHRKFYYEKPDPVDRYFKQFDLPDGRRQWMLDYLPLILGEIDGHLTPEERERYQLEDTSGKQSLRDRAWLRAISETASLHKDQILAAHARAVTDNIRLKYEWLARYHDDSLELFMGSPDPELLIGNLLAVTASSRPRN